MRRRVGGFEHSQILTDAHAPFNIVAVLRLAAGADRLDEAVVRRGLDALQRRHPLLDARLVPTADGFAFETAAPRVALASLERGDENRWRAVVESELLTHFDTVRGPLWRCTWLRSPGEETGELVITFLHAVIDSTSARTVLTELLLSLGSVGRGAAAFEPRPMPPPFDPSLPPPYRGAGRWLRAAALLARTAGEEMRYRWQTRGGKRLAVRPGARGRLLGLDLDPPTTRALGRAARKRRMLAQSVLTAAGLLALAPHLPGATAGRAPPLRSWVFPNLRPKLQPPPSPEDVASYFVSFMLTTPVAPGADLWAVAGRLDAQTRRAMRRGDRFAVTLIAPALIRLLVRDGSMRMGDLALSYIGVFDVPAAAGPLRVRDIRSFASNWDIGPGIGAQARLWQGSLLWDGVYLDEDFPAAEAEAVVGDMRSLLESAAKG